MHRSSISLHGDGEGAGGGGPSGSRGPEGEGARTLAGVAGGGGGGKIVEGVAIDDSKADVDDRHEDDRGCSDIVDEAAAPVDGVSGIEASDRQHDDNL